MDRIVKPLVIPIFIPHLGCPHQCAFCNQAIITHEKDPLPDKDVIDKVVARYLQYKGKRESVELAFFGGNFLGLSQETILWLLEMIKPYICEGKIDSIRFSTRPDTITKETLDLISPYPISAIELGVQSMNDRVLKSSNRGHTGKDTTQAMGLLKDYRVKIGVQVMVGLPQDTETSLFESTKKIADLSPDFARIYPLMVLKGSSLAQWYNQGKYQPLTLEEAVRLVKEMCHIFTAADIAVIRMGLQASEMMEDTSMVIAGPWHPAFGHLVFSEMLFDKVCNSMDQGRFKSCERILMVHPKSASRLRGDKNMNLQKLATRYPGFKFIIRLDECMPLQTVDVFENYGKEKGK